MDEFTEEVHGWFQSIALRTPFPFPYSELDAFCKFQGIDTFDDRAEFLHYMDHIGTTMVRLRKEKADQEGDKPPKQGPTKVQRHLGP